MGLRLEVMAFASELQKFSYLVCGLSAMHSTVNAAGKVGQGIAGKGVIGGHHLHRRARYLMKVFGDQQARPETFLGYLDSMWRTIESHAAIVQLGQNSY